MKSYLYLIPLLLLAILSACDNVVEPEEQLKIDKELIAEYVATNGLSGDFTESGLFIAVADSGIGTEYPSPSSLVEIIYTGTLLDGTEFDSSDGFPVTFALYSLITGWQEGIGHFRPEGKGVLLVPSRLGYGPQARTIIPANSVLRFDIELLDFQ